MVLRRGGGAVAALAGAMALLIGSGGVASASSLEGSSCSHPYRLVKNLHAWYNPAHLGGANGRTEGPHSEIQSNNIGVNLDIQFGRSLEAPGEPSKLIEVEFVVGWWFIPQHGRVCKIRITFHGLPTYVNRKPNGGNHYFHLPQRSDRPERLEITAAR
jgi:hypothetical protein